MKNQVEKYYGSILEDGRRCVSRMPNGKAIAYRPQDRQATEKAYQTATAFDDIFEGENPKTEESNPFDNVF